METNTLAAIITIVAMCKFIVFSKVANKYSYLCPKIFTMQLLIYILAYPFLWIISKLPFPIFYAVSDGICFLVYRVLGTEKKWLGKTLDMPFLKSL